MKKMTSAKSSFAIFHQACLQFFSLEYSGNVCALYFSLTALNLIREKREQSGEKTNFSAEAEWTLIVIY